MYGTLETILDGVQVQLHSKINDAKKGGRQYVKIPDDILDNPAAILEHVKQSGIKPARPGKQGKFKPGDPIIYNMVFAAYNHQYDGEVLEVKRNNRYRIRYRRSGLTYTVVVENSSLTLRKTDGGTNHVKQSARSNGH